MSKIGVFYGSTTGNAESAAQAIAKALDADCIAVDGGTPGKMDEYDVVVLGTSTWGLGDLQDDWEEIVDSLPTMDLSGKTAAFFGTGDQENYPDTFVDAMGILKGKISGTGARIIGAWPTAGYDFESSAAEEDGQFVGLALDEDNQSGESAGRIVAWTDQLKKEIG
jgi:flavodoxin I